MTSLHESIVNSIRNWPTLYGCRTDVLHQYFCVPDNGLEWIDGCLSDRYGDSTESERASMFLDETDQIGLHDWLSEQDATTLRPWDAPVPSDRWVVADPLDMSAAVQRIAIRRYNAEVQFRIDQADLLAKVPWQHQSFSVGMLGNDNAIKASPVTRLSETESAMFTVPDDVQPDWLAGVREMIFEVFRGHSAAGIVALADTALRQLHLRFPSPEGMPYNFTMWQESDVRHRANVIGSVRIIRTIQTPAGSGFGSSDE